MGMYGGRPDGAGTTFSLRDRKYRLLRNRLFQFTFWQPARWRSLPGSVPMSGRVIVLTQGSGTQPVPEQIQTMPVPGKGTRPTATPPTAMELQAGTPVIVDPACESLPSSHESFCSFKDCQFFKWLCFKPARTPCDGCCRNSSPVHVFPGWLPGWPRRLLWSDVRGSWAGCRGADLATVCFQHHLCRETVLQ